jgi:hypothetical protein
LFIISDLILKNGIVQDCIKMGDSSLLLSSLTLQTTRIIVNTSSLSSSSEATIASFYARAITLNSFVYSIDSTTSLNSDLVGGIGLFASISITIQQSNFFVYGVLNGVSDGIAIYISPSDDLTITNSFLYVGSYIDANTAVGISIDAPSVSCIHSTS